MLTLKHNYLNWLANAMTLPSTCLNERYYYDSRRNDFFSSIQNNGHIIYVDRNNAEYPIDICIDLSVRMEFINDESSDLTEIPRYTLTEKIGLQLEFLSKLPGTYWHNKLIEAVEQQQDDFKFVLDTVLIENDSSAPMASYWFDYKLNFINESIIRFRQLVDL